MSNTTEEQLDARRRARRIGRALARSPFAVSKSMSDDKYTAKELEFIRVHELQHTLYVLEQEVMAQVGPRCTEHAWILNYKTCVVCKTWEALDDLKAAMQEVTPNRPRDEQRYNKALDVVINSKLAELHRAVHFPKYVEMTPQEIFQDLIAPTTEDNDDE